MTVSPANAASSATQSADRQDYASARAGGMRFYLRRMTRDEHDATELAFARFDLSLIPAYRDFLLAHAGALSALEPGIANAGWPGWASRSDLLDADLRDLGASTSARGDEDHLRLPTDAHAWGAQYVLEGSRLGGAVLARTVPAGSPTRYLRGGIDGTEPDTLPWQEFCASLEEVAKYQGDRWKDDVEQGARAAFALFRHHANRFPGHVT